MIYRVEVNTYNRHGRINGGWLEIDAKTNRDSRAARNAVFEKAFDAAEKRGWLDGLPTPPWGAVGIRIVEPQPVRADRVAA